MGENIVTKYNTKYVFKRSAKIIKKKICIHSYVNGHLGCFHILAIVNNVAMNIGAHLSSQISAFIFFR